MCETKTVRWWVVLILVACCCITGLRSLFSVCVSEWITVGETPESLSTRHKQWAASVSEGSTVRAVTYPPSYLFITKVMGVFLLLTSPCLHLRRCLHTLYTWIQYTLCVFLLSASSAWAREIAGSCSSNSAVCGERLCLLTASLQPAERRGGPGGPVWSVLHPHPGLSQHKEVGAAHVDCTVCMSQTQWTNNLASSAICFEATHLSQQKRHRDSIYCSTLLCIAVAFLIWINTIL